MHTTSRRIGLIAAILLLATVVPAQAVEYLCGDICQCWVACTRRCTDDISGYSTTCGAAGYPCNGQCFVDVVSRPEPPAAANTCAGRPTLESIPDVLAQPKTRRPRVTTSVYESASSPERR